MDNDLGLGVKFEDDAYLGLFSRLLLVIVDSFIAFIVLIIGISIDLWLIDTTSNYDSYYATYSSMLVIYIYLTSLKTSKFGTLGQFFTKSKILTIYGEKPTQLKMSFRLFIWVLGPFNFISDLVFLTMIKEKRTLRDCYCDTIVVKKCAEPIGVKIPVRFNRVFAMGLNLMYRSCYNANT